MAIVEELFESRVGGTKGVDASTGNARIFRVTTDTRDDDPILILRADENAKANLNAKHPWDDTIWCRNHAYVQKLTHKTWVIAAIYEPTEILVQGAILVGWIMRARTSSMTELLVETLPLTMRVPSSGPVNPGHITANQELDDQHTKFIGPYEYKLALEGEEYTHVANDGITDIKLRQTDGRKQIGYQRTYPAMTFTLDKDVPNLPPEWGSTIASYKETVNATAWYPFGAEPRTVLFKDAAIDPVEGTLSTPSTPQKVKGLYWHVQLSFLWAAKPHEPFCLTHTWLNDTGNVFKVATKVGRHKVTEDFHVANGSNFMNLLRAFQ